MSDIKFTFLERADTAEILPIIFIILHENMSAIAPTGNTYEDDLAGWYACIIDALKNPARNIVLLYADGELTGFFMYCMAGDTLKMEEIQFKRQYQGSGLFAQLFGWLTTTLYPEPTHAVAYANKKNYKSQAILRHLGLTANGENANGNSLRFEGDYALITYKYAKKPT